jgi:hypothetical protein
MPLVIACGALGRPGPIASSLRTAESEVRAWLEGTQRPSFGTAIRVLEMASFSAWPFPRRRGSVVRSPHTRREGTY